MVDGIAAHSGERTPARAAPSSRPIPRPYEDWEFQEKWLDDPRYLDSQAWYEKWIGRDARTTAADKLPVGVCGQCCKERRRERFGAFELCRQCVATRLAANAKLASEIAQTTPPRPATKLYPLRHRGRLVMLTADELVAYPQRLDSRASA